MTGFYPTEFNLIMQPAPEKESFSMRNKSIITEAKVVSRCITERAGFAAVLVACGLFAAGHSFAQETGTSSSAVQSTPIIEQAINYSLSSAPSAATMKNLPQSTDMVDNAIDENSYYIGGGDKLHIYIVDMPSMNYSGVITQDYHFIEPTLGIIPIGGKVTLARAKVIIADYLSQKMKGRGSNNIRILFEAPKTAHITAFGSVNALGTHSFSGTTRLWDVLKSTTSGNMSDINFREVRRKNGDSVAYFDILEFLYKGNFSQNPYIYPGDELYLVPATKKVFIGGAGLRAWISGQIPIHTDERAKDFLSFFFFNENADSEHILIQRTLDGRENQRLTFNLKQQGEDFYLKNSDVIMVPVKNDTSEIYIANITGEVVRPGSYPISKNGIAIQTIIALAGGYTSYADTSRTVILRRGKSTPPPEIIGGLRPEMFSSLGTMAASKDYEVLQIKDHPETVFKHGDLFFVPRKENMVYLSGRVNFPGGYAFMPGHKKEFYINLAGGLAKLADKPNISIIAPYGLSYQIKSGNAEIEDGNIIVVPLGKERKFWETFFLPTFSVVMGSVSLLVALLSIMKS
jgi:protein involved in polysaccharide export with SLBB domain